MNCPACKGKVWATVLETRTRIDGSRRRTFLCGNLHKFHSVERVEEVKHGGSRKQKVNHD